MKKNPKTHNPFLGMSWRYHFGLLNKIGVKTCKGREVFLRVKQGVAK
ncbi:MAG TPA: hypothetical protein VMV89_10810 [Candidatus Paceibacterota bacterium]|nr:hypothetical protein [Candidatus Paceibacterota bacterium]